MRGEKQQKRLWSPPRRRGLKTLSTEQLLGPVTPKTVSKANEDDLQFFNKCQEKAAREEELGKPLLGGRVPQRTKRAKFDAPRLEAPGTPMRSGRLHLGTKPIRGDSDYPGP
ncbi:hypothetical protein PAL_GLEAN10016065 [Pteropus alecto]|uniref:Uncharacterized protein n=1 Tax=Pteropus alecto TaxID=9402 RepID=L5JW07_PTEAL|nr:hypothetical protein PAL_GLEAN10016065 [Pteropus alecto]